MKFILIKNYYFKRYDEWVNEKNQILGVNYSNMGEFPVIRWDLKEFKEKFPDEIIAEIREEYWSD